LFLQLRPGSKLVRAMAWRSCSSVATGCAPACKATSAWAELPLDPGTRRVLTDGHIVLYDSLGLLISVGKELDISRP
jgi:hypothetical protein